MSEVGGKDILSLRTGRCRKGSRLLGRKTDRLGYRRGSRSEGSWGRLFLRRALIRRCEVNEKRLSAVDLKELMTGTGTQAGDKIRTALREFGGSVHSAPRQVFQALLLSTVSHDQEVHDVNL